MSRFYPLRVVELHKETRDAVVVTLEPRPEDADEFDYIQGQYLTFRNEFEGQELRRSYSVCAGLDDGALRVGIKRVEGGAFSTWANEKLSAGDTIEAMPPQGRFFTPIEPEAERHYLGFAGGSGITPLLSIIKTVLSREPRSQFTLVYANRQVSSIMFREELEALKNRYLGRFSVIHVMEQEAQEIDLFTGRIDAEKMEMLFRHWIDAEGVDTAFICGPEPMMLQIAESLRKHGLSDAQIKYELFTSSQPGRLAKPVLSRSQEQADQSCEVSVTLDGVTRSFSMAKDGTAVLDAALAAEMDAPYACKAGVCSTCRAKVLQGEVEMAVNHALEDYEVRAGYILCCQSVPLSDRLALSYDE
ncbi:unnamed protein product [Cyprideis torosa]|uniref:Uncharacterized protein n=1 Tax=Cyprideis torosa TaxID=163714 RepID=A0A7R8ZXC7_9CRUS|nr:unnamed protein product [Cyprideis torosa]CAG0906893.1 unnamed protein product [Cyprideis torosa]